MFYVANRPELPTPQEEEASVSIVGQREANTEVGEWGGGGGGSTGCEPLGRGGTRLCAGKKGRGFTKQLEIVRFTASEPSETVFCYKKW